MAQETVFSKIVAGEIPSDKVYEDDLILAFKNIAPEAKVHLLVIPKSNHLERLENSQPKDVELLGHMMIKIAEIAKEQGLEKDGYRVISNNGENAGQEIAHLHFHILGGERLGKLNSK